MYLNIISSIIGILFIFAGIAGFIPAFRWDSELLFGVFYVTTLHNIVNFTIGFTAIISALKYKSDKLFFHIGCIFFSLLAMIGFIWQDHFLIIHSNRADTILYACIAALFLIL